ncbi:MAG: tricarboxylate transporter, partial [Onishia taeanensis]
LDVADLTLIGGIMPKLAIAILAVSCLLEIARCLILRPQWQHQAFGLQGLWLVGFFALVGAMLLLGFITAATLFCFVFLLTLARLKTWVAAVMALGVTAFLVGMAEFLTLTYPSGLLDPLLFG